MRLRRGRNGFQLLSQWPAWVALIVGINLLLAARSVLTKLPQGNLRVVTNKESSLTVQLDPLVSPQDVAAKFVTGVESNSPPEVDARTIREEKHAEYDGEEVVLYGDAHKTDSEKACADACVGQPTCNVYVWCGKKSGCSGERKYQECWLKTAEKLNPVKPRGRRGPGVGWISGTVLSNSEFETLKAEIDSVLDAESSRLAALRANKSLPLVFFDVEIKGEPIGRIEMVLFTDTSPRCAQNFRLFCTGEAGVAPLGAEGEGMAKHFKDAPFYRIIDQFIDQSGVNVESVYGGMFNDDEGGLKLKHEHKGLLSMANMGPNTNTNHFSIMMGPAPHLDGSYTIFGQVVVGFDVVDAVNALSIGKPENTATATEEAVIVDCGQLRKGTIKPNLKKGAGLKSKEKPREDIDR